MLKYLANDSVQVGFKQSLSLSVPRQTRQKGFRQDNHHERLEYDPTANSQYLVRGTW